MFYIMCICNTFYYSVGCIILNFWAVTYISKFVNTWSHLKGPDRLNGSFRPWNHNIVCVTLTVLGFLRFEILGTVLAVWLTGRENLFTDAGRSAKPWLFVDVLIKQEVNWRPSFSLILWVTWETFDWILCALNVDIIVLFSRNHSNTVGIYQLNFAIKDGVLL